MTENIKKHQEMGYDRSAGMFSPDGLLLQVEYAEKAVKLGSAVMGIVTCEGVVLIAYRKLISKLLVIDSFKKIFEVDSHILVTGSGVMSDGRRLIEESQLIAQKNMVEMQEPIDMLSLIKDIANVKQYYSQSGGLRPFGVKLLFAGIEENTPVLYETTPSGMYLRYLARAVGINSDKLNNDLDEQYKVNLSNKDAIKIGMKIFKDNFEKEFDIASFDVMSIDLKLNKKRYTAEEIKKIM